MLGGGSDNRGGGGAGMYGNSNTPSGNHQTHTGTQDTTKKGLPIFNSYMSLFQVQEKLKKGEVIEGVLRINPKNYEDAYISAPGGGTDIYIGGVHDRNAALHGDLVALDLLPSHHWKVLYDQLDYFLDTDETLKSLVYATHDPFAVMDEFVPPNSAAPTGQQNKEDSCQPIVKDTPNTTTATPTVASDDVNSADTSTAINKKKKKNRKNRGKNKSDGGEDVQAGTKQETGVDCAAAEASSLDSLESKAPKKAGIVVPPDMLSECSDVTDDESCCSDNLDLEASLEDQKFLHAQRTAVKNMGKFSSGASQDRLTILGGSRGLASVGSPSDAKIVELKDEEVVKEEVMNKGDTAAANTNKPDNQQKRVSTAERLFGDKLKKNRPKNSKKIQAKLASEMENKALDELVAKIELSDEKKKTKQPEKVTSSTLNDSLNSVQKDSEKVAPASSELPPNATADSSEPDGVGAPPRFMVSPYNQQVNFSASRAENNWLNHPMLNNFSNNPVPGGPAAFQAPQQQRGGGGGRLQGPSGQRGGYQQRQAPRQQQQPQQGPGHYQQQAAVEKRSVPSVAQVMRLSNWNRFVQKVGFVVHILEERHTRLGAGTLKPFADMNPHFALFSPNDNRIPRMRIPMDQCPSDLFPRKQHYAKMIYLAKITSWHDPKFAQGEIIRDIGQHGDIAAETEAFLLQIGINDEEFPEPVLDELPRVPSTGWTIPAEAFEGRKDLRSTCIFSIDPSSARDLDDALSCEPLPGNRFRVGVHIADVSYFVPYNNELDKFAAGRATSVYLIDKVIPMLPRVLCEQLCSLNPDEDRLAFSVIWEMDRAGQVQSTWFGRSVIRSCAKLSYDHAQMVIDNPGKVDWMDQEMPPISKGFKLSQVCETITMLQSLAVNMRARRHNNGALRLDQKKLSISLDQETKKPLAVTTTESKLSNQLIEEFMLLANISVAHKIHESFPTLAVLRCHPEPQEGPLHDIVNLLRTLNIDIDISCAGSIYASLRQLAGDDKLTEARQEVIVNMLSKPMQNALYFCSGTYQEDFSHYALNVPFYTHFTSPIRRYPDVMVHRLLAAAVDPQRYPLPKMTEQEIDRRLSSSNEKKMSAKRASEYSCELFLAQFVRQVREIETVGMVIGVLDHALDILLLDFCTIKRCYLDKLPLEMLNYDNRNKNDPPAIHIVWSPDHKNQKPSVSQSFTFFTQVTVILTPFTNNQLKFNVTLVRPDS